MDVSALLSSPPIASLDADVLEYLRASLDAAAGAAGAAELLAPFLTDAELADEQQTLALCQRFALAQSATSAGTVASTRDGGYVAPGAGPMAALCKDTKDDEEEPAAAFPTAAEKPKASARAPRARKAEKAQLEEAALAPGARLELVEAAESQAIARAFKVGAPELRGWIEQGPERLDMLGASFLAYAEERLPEKLPKWSQLLQELLEDSAAVAALDEDEDVAQVALKAVTQLVKSGLLQAKKKTCEVGDPVLAFLPEDQEWHPAVVEAITSEGKLKVIFIEYGKPQEVHMEDVRAMEDVADEGEEGEGECEMCQRELKLTFHHLIPKDKHPTYLGKRLPAGIEGEPTRYFLNSYGVMICRQCHNTVHNIASNEVLAAQFNTLQKLLAHPVIQRWLDFAKKRKAFSGKSR